jgi:hypothetical protein
MGRQTPSEQVQQRVRNFHLARIAGASDDDEEYLAAAVAYLRAVITRLPTRRRRDVAKTLIDQANRLLQEDRR